ncbi:hypothetical protein C8J57DRAFT_1669580 [Mycena rebaudengoi]|nr:hypothetical protein C8J57DRAFT_1669580 [Mycena rebaudengoi]
MSGVSQNSASVQHRSGPIYDDPELVKFDQAIFIRGYKVLERKIRAPKIIRTEAEPRPPSVDEDSGDSSATSSTTGGSSEFEYIVQSIEGDSTASPRTLFFVLPVEPTDIVYNQPYHPSDALLEYILEHSDAPVAIVHDDHWCGSLIHPALEGGDFASISNILDSYERRFCQSDDIAQSVWKRTSELACQTLLSCRLHMNDKNGTSQFR